MTFDGAQGSSPVDRFPAGRRQRNFRGLDTGPGEEERVFHGSFPADLPILDAEKFKVFEGVAHGAYILEKGAKLPNVLLVATG